MSPKLSVTTNVSPCLSARRGREAGAVARTENDDSATAMVSSTLICIAGLAGMDGLGVRSGNALGRQSVKTKARGKAFCQLNAHGFSARENSTPNLAIM